MLSVNAIRNVQSTINKNISFKSGVRTNYGADVVNYTSDINKVTRDQHYIIRPDEFGEYDDYDAISLTYYADHILTDEDDEIVEDIEDKIGFDALSHFGEYEEDSVFVRNDRIKCDYEILLDQRKYSEVEHYNEYQMEDEW